MKSLAIFPSRRDLRLVDQPAPRAVGPHDVALRMLEVGVCGTDREICAFLYGTPPAGCEHLVIGHESLGEVIEIGPEVTRVNPGDLVVPMVRRPCAVPSCAACGEDRQDFCFTGQFAERGITAAHGFLAEVVVDHEKYMNPVPSSSTSTTCATGWSAIPRSRSRPSSVARGAIATGCTSTTPT